MRQTRLYLEGEYDSGSELEIDAQRTHYLSRVLRLRVGDTIVIFNGTGAQFSASITALQRSRGRLVVHDALAAATESGFKLHLAQGISRSERMDFVVQKATELGVRRITPLLTEHGVVKLAAERAEKRRQHWRQVATSACEQSGRVRLPLVDAPVRLDTWLADKTQQADIGIVLKPGATEGLASIDVPATKVCLLVGPEGGFSNAEHEMMEAVGFRAVSFGPRVLRTETAAIAALAVLQARCGDMN